MKLWLIVVLVLALVSLRRFKPNLLVWIIAWLGSFWIFLRFGFTTPIPMSVLKLYMGVALLAAVAYVGSSARRAREFWQPLEAFMTEPRYTLPLAVAVVGLPLAVGTTVYLRQSEPVRAPSFARTIHPAPPETVSAFETTWSISTADSPLRHLEDEEPEAFRARLENGRRVYYQNCFYCHGDAMRGDGMFAYGLDPIPTNFADPGTIAMLREAFLFWRVTKGGPGLPDEGGPWASAMPAWEKFLTDEEVWDVVAYLYEYTEQQPRAVETHE